MKKIVFIGHVDTGKSTLYGHILYKIGYVTEHDMKKIEIKAEKDKMIRWKWARILDIYEEEMERGKTHEYSELNIKINEEEVSLIDTPGHQSFIRQMISGISCHVKSAVLMISMIDNEFEASFNRGMLKEHILLARCIGIVNFVIVANKMDAIDWDKDKMKEKIDKVLKYLKSIGCNMEKVYNIPLASYDGIGIDSTENMPEWYTGRCLFDMFKQLPTPPDKVFIKKEGKGDKILVNFTLFKVPDTMPVITSGFIGTMHYGGYGDKSGEETDVELVKIEKSRMINKMENKKIIFKTNNSIEIGINSRIILRYNNDTLGFGFVLGVK